MKQKVLDIKRERELQRTSVSAGDKGTRKRETPFSVTCQFLIFEKKKKKTKEERKTKVPKWAKGKEKKRIDLFCKGRSSVGYVVMTLFFALRGDLNEEGCLIRLVEVFPVGCGDGEQTTSAIRTEIASLRTPGKPRSRRPATFLPFRRADAHFIRGDAWNSRKLT